MSHTFSKMRHLQNPKIHLLEMANWEENPIHRALKKLSDHFTSHSETILDSEIRSPEVGCLFASLPKLDMGMTEWSTKHERSKIS